MAAKAQPISVLIVDDHRTFGEALRIAMDLERDLRVVGVVPDGDAAVETAVAERPDVVLMDVEMPGLSGIDAARRIKEASPDTRVVMLSAHDDELILARAVEAGASGYLSKSGDIDQVPSAVRQAFRGEPLISPDEVRRLLRHLRHRRSADADEAERVGRLTKRETEILQLMADGLAPDAIATRLGVSPNTLRTHVQNVLTKLAVHSKLEALAMAIRHGRVTAGAA
ncbi:MAG: response regulator transcription factor [Actinobacteria bacterium]|nr:response regulator transcription factor [Actinomycetota bacterium]